MKDTLKKNWIVLGLVWCLVLGLTQWNMRRIDQIRQEREKIEMAAMDGRFLQENSANISSVLAQRDRLYHPVESLQLGLLAVENRLKTLAAAFQLGAVKFESPQDLSRPGPLPVDLSFEGSLPRALRWMEKLAEVLPYLPIEQISLTSGNPGDPMKFRLSLSYRYALSAERPTRG